ELLARAWKPDEPSGFLLLQLTEDHGHRCLPGLDEPAKALELVARTGPRVPVGRADYHVVAVGDVERDEHRGFLHGSVSAGSMLMSGVRFRWNQPGRSGTSSRSLVWIS